MKNTIPFTYVIRNKTTGKRYYGCRYAAGCNPSDLWNTYFTSSKIIKNLIKSEGKDNWDIEIRKIFESADDCKLWEEKVLRRLGVPLNVHWYNQSIGGRKFLVQGESLEHQRNAVSRTMKELYQDPEYKEKRREIQKRRWAAPGARESHSQKMKAYWADDEWKEKVINDRIERLDNDDVRKKMSDVMLEVWTRPEYIERHRAAMKKVREDPSWIEKNSVAQKASWQDPVKRENRLKNRKPHTQERKAAQSKMTTEQNKKTWADPEIREKRIAGIKAAAERRKAAKAALVMDNSVDYPNIFHCPPNISLRDTE